MSNRFISGLLVLSIVGVCFSYQNQGDAALTRKRDEPKVVFHTSQQLPTPNTQELVFVFDNGDYTVLKIGQTVSIPNKEPFRAIAGENTRLVFSEKGDTSGNTIWIVQRR